MRKETDKYSYFQVYSLVQLVYIVEQEAREGVILPDTIDTANHSSYGSVLQPSGMERVELRVFHSLLFLVFSMVIISCFLLVIGVCKVSFGSPNIIYNIISGSP